MLTINEQLVKSIRERQAQSPHNEGILTADRYVKTIDECVGHEACYQFAATKTTSWHDLLTKSAQTLTYNNPEMVLEDVYNKEYAWQETDLQGDSRRLTLPKHTLMVFKHVLTTSRKDRDGDTMRTGGAKPDPRMNMLWNHVHTLPIGKMLHVAEQTESKLTVVSALIDINTLAHDSAVMIEAKMGRYSHGFKALEFEKNKEGGGFDIKQFEIMEESLVTVPSNVDADTTEIILGLVESRKLTSPMMKEMGKSIREKRNKTVSVPADIVDGLVKKIEQLAAASSEKSTEGDHAGTTEGAGTKCSGDAGCGCGCNASASEKADDHDAGEKRTADKEMMLCPKCNERMVDGICTKCGYRGKSAELDGEKAGRMVSGKNRQTLQHAHDCVGEIHEKEYLMSKAGKALCKDAMGSIKSILDMADGAASADDIDEKGGPGSGRRPGGARRDPFAGPRNVYQQGLQKPANPPTAAKPPEHKPKPADKIPPAKPTGRIGRALQALRDVLRGGGNSGSIGRGAFNTALLGPAGIFRRGVDDLDNVTIDSDGVKFVSDCFEILDDIIEYDDTPSVEKSMAFFLANANDLQLRKLSKALESIQSVENRTRETQQIQKLLS